jgi:hypothetical protein
LTPHAPSQKGWFWVRPQAHRAARVSASGPPGGVQDKIAADQQRPPGVRGDDGRMGWLLGCLCQQAVAEGAGGAAADDLGHGLGVGQVGAGPGPAGWVEHLRQPADAFGVVAAAARS